jgi:hypothetical protein
LEARTFSAKRNGWVTEAGAIHQDVVPAFAGPANSPGTCYNVAMTKQRKPVTKGVKAGGFVVGRARFAKISAVEGIELSQVMEKRASEADRKGLTAEEYRRTIGSSHCKS